MFLIIRTRIRNNCPHLLLFKLYFLGLRIWNHFPWFSSLSVGIGAGVRGGVLHIVLGSQEVRNTSVLKRKGGLDGKIGNGIVITGGND